MSLNARVRHRSAKISSKDRTSGTSSRFQVDLGKTTFPNARALSLNALCIPQMIPNVYTGKNTFVMYNKEAYQFTAGVNDRITVQQDGNVYNYDIGTLAVTPATIVVDFISITGGINALIPGTIDIRPDGAGAGVATKLEVSTLNGGPITFLPSTASFALGLTEIKTINTPALTYEKFDHPFGGVEIVVPPFQYTYSQLRTALQSEIDLVIAPDTATVIDNTGTNPADKRIIINITSGIGSQWFFGYKDGGSSLSPLIGYTQEEATQVALAESLPQLYGPKCIYIHIRESNKQQTMLSDEGKLVSIHACIPVTVPFGGLIAYTSPDRHYWKAMITRGSNSIKSFQLTLRDTDGVQLVDLDGYDYDIYFDFDLQVV